MGTEIITDDGEIVCNSPNSEDADLASFETDELIRLHEDHKTLERMHREQAVLVAQELARRSPRTDDCRTTRIRGENRRAKLEWPEDSWDQGILKEAYHAFPSLRDEFLTIGSLRVRLREFKKMVHENGDAAYEQFKAMITSAQRPAQGPPRVILED
jgi:hypothetical protein